MSNQALTAVLMDSQSEGIARCVAIAIADSATVFGISWLPLEPLKWKGANPKKCIVHMGRTKTRRQAIRAIKELEQLGELQIRKAQRGQRRHNVYRLRFDCFPLSEIRYEDLPFDLLEPFSEDEPEVLRRDTPSRRTESSRGDVGVTSRRDQGSPRDVSPGSRRDVTPTRARELDPSIDPPEAASASPAAEVKSNTSRANAPPPRAKGEMSDREPAAAKASEPWPLERVVSELSKLRGWDPGSLAIVEPLLWQVPGELAGQVLASTVARRDRRSEDVGYFIVKLRAQRDLWRRQQTEARLAAWDAFFGEAGIERVKREDPERYVLAWARPDLADARPIPSNMVAKHVFAYLFDYVPSQVERLRLLHVFMHELDESRAEQHATGLAHRDIKAAILSALTARPIRPYADVRGFIETVGVGLPEEKLAELLAFADELHTALVAELGEDGVQAEIERGREAA